MNAARDDIARLAHGVGGAGEQPSADVCLRLARGYEQTGDHGAALPSELAPLVVATIHPSAVLRARGSDARDELQTGLVADLKAVAERLARS